MELAFIVIGIGLYGLASVLAVVSFVRPGPTTERNVRVSMTAGSAVLVGILLLHAVRSGTVPAFSRFDAMACYSVAATAAYLHMAMKDRTRGISIIIAPYLTAMLVLAVSSGYTGTVKAPAVQNIWLGLHVLTAFVSYALFSLAGILALAYVLQDHNLKRKRITTLSRLPALETLDRLMSHQVGIAFLILTVSIVLGFVLVRMTGGDGRWLTDPKVAATVMTWAVYAVLVHMRASAGRHGRGLALVTVLGFCCVLFAFIGVHAIANSVHSFPLISIPVGQ